MLQYVAVFVVLISLQQPIPAQYEGAEEVTLDVRERVAVLKQKIYDEMQQDQLAIASQTLSWVGHQKSAELDDNYVYKDNSKDPITPIMDFDERKRDDKFKHRELYTKHPTTFVASEEFNVAPIKDSKRSRKKKRKRLPKRAYKPSDIFYRRRDYGVDLDTPMENIHHHDLLTPYLTSGIQFNTSDKIVHPHDTKVLRLVSLLSEDTKESTKDEIYSILYQISNIPMRFFQWKFEAIKLLFNEIIYEDHHDFRTLKKGLKRLFTAWHLDIGNVSNLLKQTRIFRPPCCTTSELSGSTKKPKGPKFTKPKPSKKTCPPEKSEMVDDSCAV